MPTLVTPEQRQAAKREIVWQVEQGATASVARSHSPVLMHRTTVYCLLKRVQSEGERALTDGRHGHPVKLRGEVLAFVVEHCQINPCVSSTTVQRALQERFALAVSVSQLNRVRASLGLTRKPVQLRKKSPKASQVNRDTEKVLEACSCWPQRTKLGCSRSWRTHCQQK